ncbi:MAG: hypothetical protein D3914_17195 [Candidatus Electrothrix sp. LOE2]|nr:hypothetical protein [Candidatus Electrothrix sp. LOE2]
MNNINTWIEHLHYPLVFAGFGLFIFATVIKLILLNSEKLNGTAKERVMTRGMYLAFILALLAIIGGVALNWNQAEQNYGSQTTGATVEQATQGPQSPAINSGKDVRINYGPAPAEQNKPAGTPQTLSEKTQAEPAQVQQTTQGEQSPAINSQGDVEINYGK